MLCCVDNLLKNNKIKVVEEMKNKIMNLVSKITACKLARNLLIVLAIIVALQTISSYLFGVFAKETLDKQFNTFASQGLLKVKSRVYHRGLFSSTENVELSFNNQLVAQFINSLPSTKTKINLDNVDISIKYVSSIQQGLFAGVLHGKLVPTIAYVQSDVVMSKDLQNILQQFFGKDKPIAISNTIYLNKSGVFNFYSPSFDYSEALSGVKVNWLGMKGKVAYNANLTAFDSKFALPGFSFSAPTKGEFSFDNLVYKSSGEYSVNNIKVGSTEINLESVAVNLTESDNQSMKLGAIINKFTGLSAADFVDSIDVIDPTKFTISNLAYKSSSSDEDGFYSSSIVGSIEAVQSKGKTYGPMNLDLAFSHIASPALNKVFDLLANMNQMESMNQDERIELLKNTVAPVLIQSPKIVLNDFSITTPSGKIEINGNATTKNFVESDVLDTSAFLSKISADINVSVPRSTLAYIILIQMQYMLGGGQMDVDSTKALTKIVDILLNNKVNAWVKEGYLKQDGEIVSTSIKLESGETYLNGILKK